MKTKNKKILKYMIVLSIILITAMASGCGKDVVPKPTNMPELTVTPAPTNTPEPENTPEPPTATPYPSGDTWDVSEEVPLEDWQIEIVLGDLTLFWDTWMRFEGGLNCDSVLEVVSRQKIVTDAYSQACQDALMADTFILGPSFDWLVVNDARIWPDSKGEIWPGGVAIELDTEYEWETREINPIDGSENQTLYGRRTRYFIFLTFEDGLWRVYTMNKEIEGKDF